MSLPEALFWSVVVIFGMPVVVFILDEWFPSELDILKLKKENRDLCKQLEELQKEMDHD